MPEITTENSTFGLTPMTDPESEEMLKAGVHLGHAKGKSHPAMQPYIFGARNNISVIDLTKTKEKLAEALNFLKDLASQRGVILLVGTTPGAKKAIEEAALSLGMPFVIERWVGGTLTNFKVINQRVLRMEELEKEKSSGDFDKYTKKERSKLDEELRHLVKLFGGLRTLKKIPEAIFVVDITHEKTAVREARRKKIPIVALTDTNSDAGLIDWPVPSNDSALPALRYMIGRIKEAIAAGQKMQKKETE